MSAKSEFEYFLSVAVPVWKVIAVLCSLLIGVMQVIIGLAGLALMVRH